MINNLIDKKLILTVILVNSFFLLYILILLFLGISNNSFILLIIIGIVGSAAGNTSIFIIQRKKTLISGKKNKLAKKRNKLRSLIPRIESIKVSDIKSQEILKRLIKSEITLDSIKDKRILNFFDDEFTVLSETEINYILNLNIPDISEKLIILKELASLSHDERKEFLKNLKIIDD